MLRKNAARRHAPNNGSLWGVFNSKSRMQTLLPRIIALVGFVFIIGYFFRHSGESRVKEALNISEGDFTCTSEIMSVVPFLKTTYDDSMHKVLHVGPDTCSLISKFLKDEEIEVWGIEPYDVEDSSRNCKHLVHKGIVRVADIKFSLSYRADSFSLVLISDAVDYLSPKYLNKTLLELARVSSDSVVIFAGYPGRSRAKVPELSKFGRPAKMRSPSWWSQFLIQAKLDQNEDAMSKFEEYANKNLYKLRCQIFHIKS